MKRVFTSFAAILVIIAAGSCQKEQDSKDIPHIESVQFNVIADGSISTDESKTAVVDGDTPSVKWLSTDALTVYEIVDGSVNTSTTTSGTVLSDNGYVASFSATLSAADPDGASYQYAAVYPATSVSQGNNFYRLTMPYEQHLNGNNFSSDSDILISTLYDNGTSRVSSNQNVSFRFRRVGTAIKLTLKGITAGEKIKKVVITAPHYIAGRVKYVPATSSLVTDSWHYGSEHQSTITLTIDDVVATGADVLWFRVLAAEDWVSGENLALEVETDRANYYRNGRDEDHAAITLNQTMKLVDGGLTAFGVNFSAYRVEKPAGTRYTKVTNTSGIVDGGEYLVVATKQNGTDLCALSSFNNSNFYNAADVVEIDDNGTKHIIITSETVNPLTLESAGNSYFYIKDSEGQYLNYSGSDNKVFRGAKSNTNSYKWTVSTNAITNVGSNSRVLKYNPDAPRFACYTSASNITLYFKDNDPSLTGTDVEFTSAVAGTEESTLSTNNLSNVSFTCLEKPAWIGTVSFNGNTMTVSSTDNRTLEERVGTITVQATGTEGSVTAEINVSQVESVFSASSSDEMAFAWDDATNLEIQSTTITSTFLLTEASNVAVTGADADKFIVSLTRDGSTDNYILEVVPNEDNESGADYEATVTVSRDDLSIPISLVQAFHQAVAYSTGFESSEGFTTHENYQSTWIEGANGKQWEIYYGSPSTSSCITGSQSLALRLYSTTPAHHGYAEMLFDVYGATGVSFKAKAATSNGALLKLTIKESFDGSNWSVVSGWDNHDLSTNATNYSFTVSGTPSQYRIRFEIGTDSTQPSSKNAQLTIDDVNITVDNGQAPPTPVATATVTTLDATSITSSSAQLNGSFSGASGVIYETGFYWGTSENNLSNQVTTDGTNASSGSFNCTIGTQTPLNPSTDYYFKAYVLEFNESTSQYEERLSDTVLSFTTSSVSPQPVWSQYLSDYGMPNVSGLGTSLLQSGTYSDRDDNWYSVSTSNNKRQIAIHTYSQGAPNNAETLSYVVLYDETKYAPVWTYHVMNTTKWPDNNVGRNDGWTDDPAISLTQQGGLDNASSVGYSRGHLVASNYRQTSIKQNKQTFYHSNQAPQWQNSFNSGVWSSLEERVVTVAPSGTTMLYVVTGVLYEGSTTTKPSGSLNVPIPSHFYKCIMKCTFTGSDITGAQGIAFVYTNEAHNGNYYDNSYVTSIDAIEVRAGFDFFANVPSGVQASAEANTSHSWFTGK